MFPDAEDSIWAFDEKAGQWYLHHFYSHQPDLNIANPRVRDEIAKIAGFWLELGVDGFRVDAVPFLIETGEVADVEPRPARDPAATSGRSSPAAGATAMLLGEVNLPPEQLIDFFGGEDGDEVHLLFNFPDAGDLPRARPAGRRAARQGARARRSRSRRTCQYANFVRNHDELTLDKLIDERAPGGLRRVRPRRGHAALRPRAPPPAPVDARRRPAADPDGLQPAVLAAGDARAVLRRGDRHGREPRRSRAG